MTNRLFNIVGQYLLRSTFDVRVIKDSSFPRRNYVISSNHLNWLDPILITLIWPSETSIMYIGPRQAVTNAAWKRWFVRNNPQIILTPQRRGWLGKVAYQAVLRGLNEGKSLLIFPEGDAYPQEGELKPFSNGVVYFALKTGVPIIPVGLCGTAELYYRKHLLVHIGRPIEVPWLPHPNKKQVEDTIELLRESNLSLIYGYRDPDVAYKPLRWLTHLL